MTRWSIAARIRATVTDFNRYPVGKGKFTLAVDTWPDISAPVSLPPKILILLYVHTTMLARPEQHVIFGIGVANHVLCSIKPPPPQKSRVSPYSRIIMYNYIAYQRWRPFLGWTKSLVKSLFVCYIMIVSARVTTFTFPNTSARLLVINVTQHAPLLLSTTIIYL